MEKKDLNSPLKALDFLIGKWTTEGEVMEPSSSQPVKIKGTDSYERALNGNFILHRVDVMMGDVRTEVLEMIGEYDKEENSYKMRSFDSEGAFTTMHASLNKNMLEIDGGNMRAKLIKGQDSMNAHWEISEDGKNWKPWMVLKLTRM